jgi:RimJ/RimL family protein N-acetyltransferase
MVLVRRVEPGDAEALTTGFEHLSATSAYQRFFTVFPSLTPAQTRFLTDVDHRDHEALGAVLPETGVGVGITRFNRSPTDPTSAEFAIVVADAWQRRGVGYQLLRALVRRARDEDIGTLTADVLTENPALLALLRHFGPVRTQVDGPTTTATLHLPVDATDGTDAQAPHGRATSPVSTTVPTSSQVT